LNLPPDRLAQVEVATLHQGATSAKDRRRSTDGRFLNNNVIGIGGMKQESALPVPTMDAKKFASVFQK
jgi:hypothetical protein